MPRRSFVALHTNVNAADDEQYKLRTTFPTGGVWRVPLRGHGFGGRAAWVVPPEGLLSRPSSIAFSRCGTVAYVVTFFPPDSLGNDAGRVPPVDEGGCDPRGVAAFHVPPPRTGGRGRSAQPWVPHAAWDAAACARAGLHPWALAVDRGSGALLVTMHGGAAGHCLAQLCPRTGAVRATWRHQALAGEPNALALL